MSSQNLLIDLNSRAGAGLYRIGSVSRLAQVPVSTLRIWEARYGAFAPQKSEGRHRLYGETDVLRASLLRQLTETGHSIGRIARLPIGDLQQMLSKLPGTVSAVAGSALPARLAIGIVGAGLATRVTSSDWARRPGRVLLDLRFMFDSIEEALSAQAQVGEPACDLLLVRMNALQPVKLDAIVMLWRAARARHCILLYNFAAHPTLERAREAGITARREPIDDGELAELVASIVWAPTAGLSDNEAHTAAIPARRYTEQELAAIAAHPPRMLCECPRHLSEIISELASFEDYSAACLNDSEEDARIHAHLRSVAGSARALFEGALGLVIAHEAAKEAAG